MQIKLTSEEGMSKIIKCEKGQEMQEISINPSEFPNLILLLKELDSNSSCTGIDVIDHSLPYCVQFYAIGWSMEEKDKGMPISYDIDEEGLTKLNEAQKEEIDQLANLI